MGGEGAAALICDLLAKDLLYPLWVIDGTGKVREPAEMLENLMLICFLFS